MQEDFHRDLKTQHLHESREGGGGGGLDPL